MGFIERMNLSIESMTLGEKFLGSIVVTLLGMAIVFAGLAILYFSIMFMEKIMHKPASKEAAREKSTSTENEVVEEIIEDKVDQTELVAVITAAIAASLNTSTHNIIVRNIRRVEDTTPSWAKMGRLNQINTRL